MRGSELMNRKNKVIAVLAAGAVAILVCSTVARCAFAHAGEDVATTGDEAVSAVQETSEADEAQDATGTADAGTTIDAMGLLKATSWASDDGKATMSFKDGRYVESDGTASMLTTFDVGSVKDDGTQTSILLAIDQADGTQKDSLVVLRKDASGRNTIASDDFKVAKAYHEASVGTVEVTGLNAEYRELVGGDEGGLATALNTYAATHAPGARTASWRQQIVIDYSAQTATTSFSCDDAASTVLIVTYSMTGKTFTVAG